MILLKKIITLTMALLMLWSVTAQELITFVPKDASLVSMVNLEKIKTKADFEELIKLPFIKKLDSKIAKEISRDFVSTDSSNYLDLRKYGINVNSKSYFYFVAEKKMFSGALLFSINNKNKFTEFAKSITGDKKGEKISKKDNYLQTQYKKDLRIIWNDKVVVFMGGTVSPSYKKIIKDGIKKQLGIDEKTNGTEFIVEEEKGEEDVVEENKKTSYTDVYELEHNKIDSLENEWFKKNTANFIKSKGTNSYANNTDFNNYLKSKPDVAFVFDYGLFSDMYMSSIKTLYPRSLRKFLSVDFIKSFTNGMKMYSKLDFAKDDVTLNFDIKYGKKINEAFAKVKKKKISKDFLKYMNKDIMGYYAFGIDIEGYVEGTKKCLRITCLKLKNMENRQLT